MTNIQKTNKKLLIPIAGIAVGIFVSVLVLQASLEAQSMSYDGPPKAVIIDQLSHDIPNKYFEKKAREYLESAGYQLDIIKSENVTVDFYKKLPKMNYELIIFRTHSVGHLGDETPVTIFTGESYTTEKYINEQFFGQVRKVAPLLTADYVTEVNPSNWVQINETTRMQTVPFNVETESRDEYFGISPKMVDELMEGKFISSTIILGGCGTLSNNSMAESLVKRGASKVIGWSDLVGSHDNDTVLLKLMEEIANNPDSLRDSVDSITENYQMNKKYPAELVYYSNQKA